MLDQQKLHSININDNNSNGSILEHFVLVTFCKHTIKKIPEVTCARGTVKSYMHDRPLIRAIRLVCEFMSGLRLLFTHIKGHNTDATCMIQFYTNLSIYILLLDK